mmetsp:Transcript_20987/g.58360  ORF Transcript_20987/g.58360 Transcript_20987/m.58360 type:complete len:87 (+) Transcript_20987:777-1037(+)
MQAESFLGEGNGDSFGCRPIRGAANTPKRFVPSRANSCCRSNAGFQFQDERLLMGRGLKIVLDAMLYRDLLVSVQDCCLCSCVRKS